MVFHIEWVTTGVYNPVIQVWLKLYCLEGVNVVSLPVRDKACLQNLIECHCTPGLCWVRSERHIQLFNIVVCNPLSQFLGKKLQYGWLVQYTYVTGGCCLAWLAACPDTLSNCCFSSIMSSPGAESCPWPSIYIVYHKILVIIWKQLRQHFIWDVCKRGYKRISSLTDISYAF